jgi:hypothetical protein
MLGLIIGVISGVIQFLLLQRFTSVLSTGKFTKKTVIFAITQFLFPFAVLVVCAFLISDSLMWIGIGMALALITCAITKFLIMSKNRAKTDQNKK